MACFHFTTLPPHPFPSPHAPSGYLNDGGELNLEALQGYLKSLSSVRDVCLYPVYVLLGCSLS